MSSEKIICDISDKTIVILFIITLLVSSIGTFLVVKSIDQAKTQEQNLGKTSNGGVISLNIERPVQAGKASIDIVERDNTEKETDKEVKESVPGLK